MKKSLIATVALGGLGVTGGVIWWLGAGSGEVTEEVAGPVYDSAPAFSLKTYDGQVVTLDTHSGQTRVINLWSTWCPFCVDELPEFAELQKRYPDIVVIAINRAEIPRTALGYIENTLGSRDSLLWLDDPEDSYYQAIGGFAMPETLFVDGDGNIRVHKRGPIKLDEMSQIIEEISNG